MAANETKEIEKIIRIINKRYHIINLENVLNEEFDKRIDQKKIASIVFDDGYKDFKDIALPILIKYKIRPSVYVVTSAVENNIPIWTYKLDKTIAKTKKINHNEQFKCENYSIKSLSNRIKFANSFKKYLKQVDNSKRESILEEFFIKFNDVNFEENTYMNWQDLREISSFVSIGYHTHTHPMLGKMYDKDEIKHELTISKKLIELNLGIECKTISYPNGSFNDVTKISALHAGYKFGLAVDNSYFNLNKFDEFEIPRIELFEESRFKLFLRRNLIIEIIKNKV